MTPPSPTRLSLLILAFAACGGDDLPVDPCVSDGPPTLSGNVAPLFAEQCALSGCHGARPEADLSLDGTPSEIHAQIVGVAAVTTADLPRIAPGDPDGSFLVRKLERSFDGLACVDDDCGVRMPKAADALRAECTDIVRAWIETGALDD